MLRVSVEVEEKYAERFDGILQNKELLRKHGVEIARSLEHPDLTWIQDGLLWEANQPVLRDKPLIVYERNDLASLREKNRALLEQANVLACTKEIRYRDKSFYNSRPTELFSEGIDAHRVVLSDAALAKIVSVHPIFLQRRFELIRSQGTLAFDRRKSDLFFAGQMNYTDDAISLHRRMACEALLALGSRFKVLIGVGRCFDQRTFYETLERSKAFLSPYGYGEYSWKDYEAVFCGCILIKPDSDDITAYGLDIYRSGRHCVRCRPDFSDLDDVFSAIVENLDEHAEMALATQKNLVAAAADRERVAEDVALFLKGLV